jgi:hypothetical protein
LRSHADDESKNAFAFKSFVASEIAIDKIDMWITNMRTGTSLRLIRAWRN